MRILTTLATAPDKAKIVQERDPDPGPFARGPSISGQRIPEIQQHLAEIHAEQGAGLGREPRRLSAGQFAPGANR